MGVKLIACKWCSSHNGNLYGVGKRASGKGRGKGRIPGLSLGVRNYWTGRVTGAVISS